MALYLLPVTAGDVIHGLHNYVYVHGLHSGFPQGLENRENREKNNGQGKVREKSGNFILGQKSGKSQGILF